MRGDSTGGGAMTTPGGYGIIRAARWGCGTLLLLFVLAWVYGSHLRSSPAYQAQLVGSHAVLRTDTGVDIGVACDQQAVEEMIKAAVAGDLVGLGELAAAGRMVWVPSGTAVLVVDGDVFSCRVRVLTGPHAGQAGWVAAEMVVSR
jgi:hypothetical protein